MTLKETFWKRKVVLPEKPQIVPQNFLCLRKWNKISKSWKTYRDKDFQLAIEEHQIGSYS